MIEDVTHTDVNPLASPKGTHKPCIRCGERSRFMCKKCRAVFYCSKAHRDEDLRVLHSDVCDLYAFLKDSIRFVPGQDERDRLEKQRVIKKTEILETAKSLAQKSLFQNHPDDAINQLSVAIHFAHELYGNNSVLIIPIHAMCVEALVKRGRMDQATQQLSKAEWILLNEDDCPDLIKADFYKNEGFLNMCKKEYKSALTSYANETFFSTAAFHPEHPRTSCGFFHLGQAFLALGQTSTAYDHYLHATDIWLKRLGEAFRELTAPSDVERVSALFQEKKIVISQEQQGDARDALLCIMKDTVAAQWDNPAHDSVKVTCALGLYCYITGDYREALNLAEMAIGFLSECPDPELREQVHDLRKHSVRALPVEKDGRVGKAQATV